jgi:hypothetical protein
VLLLEDRVLPSISLHIAPLHLAAPKTNTPPGQMVIHKETASPVLASPLSVRTSSQTGTLIPGPGFNGIGLQDEYNQGLGFIPPDTMGVIGPTLTGGKKYFVELINGQFAVFNAVGGALVASESLDTFWSAVSPVGGTSDPHLFYDKQSGRWFATTIDINNGVSGNHWLLAVSQTNDPTGSWFQYKINNINGSSEFADYDTLGVDGNGVYSGFNMFPSNGHPSHAAIFGTLKAPLLTGSNITTWQVDNITDMFTPQPADNYDTVAASDPGWIVSTSTSHSANVEYKTWVWNGANAPTVSATSQLTTPGYLPVGLAPSKGGTIGVDTDDDRLYMAVIRAGHLYTSRTVGVDANGSNVGSDSRTAAEYLELQVTPSTHVASVTQTGRLFDTAATNPEWYYYPSVMVNANGVMAMGFSGSSAVTDIGAFITSRQSSDPIGQLSPVTQIKAGQGDYTIDYGTGQNRWGDFSFTSLDPNDDVTMWTIQEYAATPGSSVSGSTSRWGTWIQQLAFGTPTTTLVTSSPDPSGYGQAVSFTASVTPTVGGGTPTGTVDFTDGSTDLTPGGVTMSGGTATFSTFTLSLGSHTITAHYSGDSQFGPSTGDDSTDPQIVEIATETSVQTAPDPSALGQAVTVTAAVAAVAGGTGTPTGSIQFQIDGSSVGTGTLGLVSGVDQSTFSTASLAIGQHAISAFYSGDSLFAGSNSTWAPLTQVVTKDPTQTQVASMPRPAVLGQVVTLTGTVTAQDPAAGTPTGTVDFADGATDLTPGGVTLAGGVATFTTASLGVGSHVVTASYSGDSDFTTSSGNDSLAPEVVNKASSNTSLNSSPNSSVFGQGVTFTASVAAVSSGAGTPSGTVDFTDGATDLTPGGVSVSGGVATFTTAALAVGTHTITASYSGDANFLASQGNDSTAPQMVNNATSSTALNSAPNSSTLGQKVTFTATVSAVTPGAGTPTGTVDFTDGATDLTPGGVTLTGGVATFTTASLAVASHTIAASYSGDAGFLSSQASDAGAPQVVQRGASVTVLFASPNPAVFGQPVLFTAAVRALTPGTGTPTGAVVFNDGSTSIGSATINGSGRVTFTYSALARGNHAITASYQGDSNFAGSSYANYGEPINRDATTTNVTANINPVQSGNPVTLTAAVTASAPGSGTPSGTVTFMDFTAVLATVTLNGAGTQTFSTSSLAQGMHAITAAYAQSNNFLGSASPVFAETVSGPFTSFATAAQVMNRTTTPGAGSGSIAATSSVGVAELPPPTAHPQPADAANVDRFFAAATPRTLPPERTKAPAIEEEDWFGTGF